MVRCECDFELRAGSDHQEIRFCFQILFCLASCGILCSAEWKLRLMEVLEVSCGVVYTRR